MSEHTQQPWRYDPSSGMVLANDGQMNVCDVRGWGYLSTQLGATEATLIQDRNGHLIAAAPELLAACKAMLAMLEDGMYGIRHPNPVAVVTEVSYAISKAERTPNRAEPEHDE